MIREVALEADDAREWTSAIRGAQINVRVVNCRPDGPKGMLQFIAISSREPVAKMLKAISSHPNVRLTDLVRTNDHRASGLVVTRNSPFCRTIAEMKGFCLGCYYSDAVKLRHSRRVIFESGVSLSKVLRRLKERGVAGAVRGVENLKGNDLLTFNQEEALKLAEAMGYFSLPRKVSIRQLAAILGMAPSTLDEVLRRAEGKVVSRYTSEPG